MGSHGGGPMGSHGGDPWDPRVGPWGPIGPWGPGPLGTHWHLGTQALQSGEGFFLEFDFAYKLRIGGARAELLHPLRLRVATARAPDAQVMSYFVMCHMMDRDWSRDAHPEDEACEKEVDSSWLIT